MKIYLADILPPCTPEAIFAGESSFVIGKPATPAMIGDAVLVPDPSVPGHGRAYIVTHILRAADSPDFLKEGVEVLNLRTATPDEARMMTEAG